MPSVKDSDDDAADKTRSAKFNFDGPFENPWVKADSDADAGDKTAKFNFDGPFENSYVKDSVDDAGAGNKKRRFAVMLISLVVIFFLIWAVLRPTKPKFIIQDATVFLFNVSAVNFLSTSIQVTITARNPNDIVGIQYDRLDVSAVYMDQQITLPTAVRPTYQRHGDVNVWSPFLVGDNIPIAPYIGADLGRDRSVLGPVLFSVKLDGRVRFKAAWFTSSGFHLNVDCPADIVVGNPTAGVVVGNNVVKYRLVRPCSVSVN